MRLGGVMLWAFGSIKGVDALLFDLSREHWRCIPLGSGENMARIEEIY